MRHYAAAFGWVSRPGVRAAGDRFGSVPTSTRAVGIQGGTVRGRCSAAAVTIAVLLAAAVVTIEGGGVANATVRQASSGVDAATLAARDLLAFVPTAFRGRCSDSDISFDDQTYTQAVVTSFSAAVNCSTADGDQVYYTKFDDRAGADGYLETIITVDNYKDASTKLSDCPSATTYSTTEGKKKRQGGRVFCFPVAEGFNLAVGTPVVVWTDERLAIVGEAFNADQPEHVHHFFAHDSGPLTKPDRSGIPVLPTAASLRTHGKSLLGLVPKGSARGCTIVNDFSREALGTLYKRRLWIVADVEGCRPVGGPEAVEYIRFANTDALNQYYTDIADPVSFANTQTVHGITCPGSNTYKANGRRAGGVKCYFANADTEGRESVDPYFHLVWSSTPTNVAAFAISPSADERVVMEWWGKRGGPIVK
jgi:hypothetical protein